ncbi:MAG: hypoxanthine phosphoribosyltransferase [Clostridia bacterium]|nr:hypoxanthine phosphoribosyltransferase [Clostridia bacterium]
MNEDITDVIEEVLISEDEIKSRIAEMAEEIGRDYHGKDLCVLSVLSGSFIFAADMVRALKIPVKVSFIFASSYGAGTESSGKVDIIKGKGFDPKGLDILILEDIVDTGRTLTAIKKLLLEEGAKSVEICTFLDKPERRVVDLHPKYVGFVIPNKFVAGYGLDYEYRYRQFPFVGILKPEMYEQRGSCVEEGN